jgi:phosphatidylglycerol:prolipoprotein diacylglycerol transferase
VRADAVIRVQWGHAVLEAEELPAVRRHRHYSIYGRCLRCLHDNCFIRTYRESPAGVYGMASSRARLRIACMGYSNLNRLIELWQHLPHHISPTLISIGSFQIRYYGLMYLVAFYITYRLVMYRINDEHYPYSSESIQDLFVWLIVGLLAGARLGYVFFYNFDYYSVHPLEIIIPFDFSHGVTYVGISGMSYHGGALGVVAASVIFCRRRQINFWNLADLFAAAVPLGYTFGRIGNFINGELYGRITEVPWGMYFPMDSSGRLRHPSQLYEAFFEGIVLFLLLWSVRKKSRVDGFLLALYLMGYGIVRFLIEFARQPDMQLGFITLGLTMGQLLCLLMIAAGAVLMVLRRRSSAAG